MLVTHKYMTALKHKYMTALNTQIHDRLKTQIHDRTFSWVAADSSIKTNCGVKLVLWVQTSHLRI